MFIKIFIRFKYALNSIFNFLILVCYDEHQNNKTCFFLNGIAVRIMVYYRRPWGMWRGTGGVVGVWASGETHHNYVKKIAMLNPYDNLL